MSRYSISKLDNCGVYCYDLFTMTQRGSLDILANGYFRLKARELLEKHDTNLHRASQKGQVTYGTLHRYVSTPEEVKAMSTRVLYAFLVDGLGYSPAELEDLRFGDVFEVVKDNPEAMAVE